MEDLIKFSIPEFKIEFQYPEWWDHKIEEDGNSFTYLFWDEFTGSFRITPGTISNTFVPEQFLKNEFERQEPNNPEWKTYNGRKFLYYEEEVEGLDGPTQMHYYITGEKTNLIICSFAYSKELLEDEFSLDELEGALESVDLLLESLIIK